MTGFGRATASIGTASVAVQVSSVNRKGLDLTVKLPEAWSELEVGINERVRAVAVRGKVHVEVAVARGAGEADEPWDERQIAVTLNRLEALAKQRGLAFAPSADLLWQIAASQRGGAEALLTEDQEAAVLAAVDEALRSFVAMRAREGSALLNDFLARLETLRRHTQAIAERAPQVAPAYRDVLMKRLRDAGLEFDLDDERVLKEIALFADRSDVTEELTRLRSHLQQFETLLRADGEIGRKAEFILQEVGREVHTICSKANDLTISKRVLKEIALFADRSDVTEELTRLRSHLQQFETLLRADGEIGRKAEFILQEVGREVHTIGSKANDLTISKHVIELKNELERVREQMANVE